MIEINVNIKAVPGSRGLPTWTIISMVEKGNRRGQEYKGKRHQPPTAASRMTAFPSGLTAGMALPELCKIGHLAIILLKVLPEIRNSTKVKT